MHLKISYCGCELILRAEILILEPMALVLCLWSSLLLGILYM